MPCHRDLHPGNLLYTQGNFLAIDYTWGAMDDPYIDLATIAIFHCETPAEEELLLQLYLGCTPRRIELARLALMKLPAKIFYGLEFLTFASAHLANEKIPLQIKPKSHRNFGQHNGAQLNPFDSLNYAGTLLNEVIEYSRSEQYAKDLEAFQSAE
jgi:hypothetical protein